MTGRPGDESSGAPIFRLTLFTAAILAVLPRCASEASLPAAASPPAQEKPPPYLLLHDWYGASPVASPSYIQDHAANLDSLPFDGIATYVRSRDLLINISANVMKDRPLREEDIETCLAPVKEWRLANLTQNFAAVFGGRPPDFMDDWSVPIGNWAKLAKAAKKAGLRGLYFDNETYDKPWGNHPEGVTRPEISLKQYQAQARLRGRQVMEAVVKEAPEIVVIFLHGPYISDRRAPSPLFPQWQDHNELLGPFFAGFVEGAGDKATVVDGGELYQLRTDREFRESLEWRKLAFAFKGSGADFLSPDARRHWAKRVKVAFGVYDRPFKGRDMTPEILAPTLERALRCSDSYVWLYIEGPTFLKPPDQGGAPEAWIDAVRRAKERLSPPRRR